MNLFSKLLVALVLFSFLACKNSGPYTNEKETIEITIFPEKSYQTIHNFGASDCWSGQFVGNWPDNLRNEIVDLLFSREVDGEGNPLGIGLSCWRFNIGAGSSEQGDKSYIYDEWRRAQGFLNGEGSYNWDALYSQRWILKAAKERGCQQFIGFLNSPPVQMSKNGKAFSSGDSTGNLSLENYSQFAGFLADVVENIMWLDEVELNYISPFNEPQWDWKADENGLASQEGSPWMNYEIKEICQHIDSVFALKSLNTKIELPESAQLNYLFETADKPGRANQIEDFFSPGAENFVGNLPHVAKKVAGHSYFTTWDDNSLIQTRKQVADKINDVMPELEFWMTEYCILENNKIIEGNGRDLGIGPALYMARVIHADLVYSNANAWHWWLAVSPYDYKDGLVYIEKSKTGGKIEESKKLWALGNFSRFVTPGSKRIGVEHKYVDLGNLINGLLISGYMTREENYVCVIVNSTGTDHPATVNVNNVDIHKISAYITSGNESDNLSKIQVNSPENIINIPSASIVTVILRKTDP